MSGLKIIPLILALVGLTYVGTYFIEANRLEVVVNIGKIQTPPAALGFVLLSAVMVGMVISGLMCSMEILALYVQNKRLRRKLPPKKTLPKASVPVDAPKEPPAGSITAAA